LPEGFLNEHFLFGDFSNFTDMNFIVRTLISTLAILITDYLLPGVAVDNIMTAVLVAIVLSFLNSFLKPLMVLFSLPITVYTLGLFLLVINTIIILLTAKLVSGFHVSGFWSAMGFSIVLSLVNSVLEAIRKRDERNQGD
jgi:putative membrane protein